MLLPAAALESRILSVRSDSYSQSSSISSQILAVGLSQLMNGPRPQRRSSSGPSPERGSAVRIHFPDVSISDPWFRAELVCVLESIVAQVVKQSLLLHHQHLA
jgi:hypothetical protein